MIKRLVLLTLLLGLILVACSNRDEEKATETPIPTPVEAQPATESPDVAGEEIEPVIVQFAVLDFEQGLYNDLVDAFEEENPDVDIKYVSIEEVLGLETLGAEWPDDARRRLVSAADVSSYFFNPEAVQDGLLLDLEPLMEADRNFDTADFLPGVLDYYQFNGGTWAVPNEANYQLIFFNKDAFDEAGVDHPQADWSWEDFLATAEALTVREGDETTQWGFVEAAVDPALFIEGRLGPLFDLGADPPAVTLDDPEVGEAMRWYVDLYQTHEVAPFYPRPDDEGGGLNIPEGYLVIEQGQAAMWPDVSASYPYRSQQINLGVVPFPVDGSESASNPLIPSGLSISVGSANPEAAWRWVDYLSRQASDPLALYGGRGSLPARLSVAEASGFWNEVDEELGAALGYAVDHSYASVTPPGGSDALYDALLAVIDGDKTIEEALADAQIAAEKGIEESLAEADGEAEIVVVEQSEAESPDSAGLPTVEFVAITGILEMQAFRDLTKKFQEENPDILVELKQPDFFSGTPTMKDIAAESDCFQWFPDNFNDQETQDALLSLDPFLDADADIEAESFYPVVMEAFKAQGQTWGLPGQVNITLIEYNKDLFDAAGEAYPSPNWTTDEFLAKAVALTQGEGETQQYGYVPDLFEPADMLNMLDRLGADLIDDSVDPPVLTLDDPQTIEAVRWYTGLTTEHAVKPVLLTSLTGAAVTAVQERQALLNEGRAAMWTNSAFNVDFSTDEGEAYSTGAVPLPAGTGSSRGSGYQNATGYFISTDTELHEACWRWIKFLTEQPSVGNGLPSRQAVAESAEFRQQVGPELADAYLASMEGATEPPFSQQISNENNWLNYPVFWLYGAYDQIVNGELGVDEALGDAQQFVDEYQACLIAAGAFNDEDGQKQCMMQTDDTLPAFLFGTD